MRHLFFILMIALLPLRGWVSDAMATSMVTAQVQQHIATKIIAVSDHGAGLKEQKYKKLVALDASQTAGDCASHAADRDGHAADTHCDSCSACQACHTVGLSAPAADVTTAFHPRTPPRAVVAQFVSAERALDQKPPIS